jgi:predicted nucleic acid-binding protein
MASGNASGRWSPAEANRAFSPAHRPRLRHVPNRRPDRDAFIAATASTHRFAVVTRNIAGFQSIGVKLVNPWN